MPDKQKVRDAVEDAVRIYWDDRTNPIPRWKSCAGLVDLITEKLMPVLASMNSSDKGD